MLNQVPAIIFKLNTDLECDYVNIKWEEFTGIKKEKALGSELLKVIHFEDLDKCKNAILRSSSKREPFQIEARLLRNDGAVRRCLFEGMPYYDINGQFDGYIGSIIDISEIKTIKEKLDLYLKLAEITENIIMFIDLDGNIVDANNAAIKAYGYTYDELCSMNIYDIRVDKEYVKSQMETANKSGIFFEATHRRKDGSCFDVEVSSRVIMSDDKRVLGSIIRDISERKAMEEKLRESEKLKEVLLANLPGMAYRCNYDREWTMQFVSDGCYELTGYRPESLLHNKELSFNDIINPEYRDFVWDKWSQVLEAKGSFKEEYSITTAAGKVKWVFEQGHGVFDENGEVVALEGLIIDITDRKRKEEEIRYLNDYDILTGLYNRRYLDSKMKMLDTEDRLPLSVIIGDINGLKQINDALGHDKGDKLLAAVAKVFKGCLRKVDILARVDGDDFCILLPNTSNDEAHLIMKRIEMAIDEHKHKEMFYTSISLGCATKTITEEALNDITKMAEDNMYSNKLLQNKSFHSSIVASMKRTLFEKSQETEEHAARLIVLSKAIAGKLNLADEQLNELELLSVLHDIGKIGITDIILNKPGKLTESEWAIMKKHPEIGYRIAMSTPLLSNIAEYILYHHERYDGNGYPKGLKGDEIPLLSRIIAVVDSFDAMTTDRPYRKAMDRETAITEMLDNAGKQFDPEIVKIFIDIITES